MTAISFLDCLDKLLSPVQLAEEAVKEDDLEKLRTLLNSCDDQGQHPITEDTLVNAQAKETLLHFAVHQEAGRCVALVCNQPFCWDADRPNLIGRSPLNLAESRGYLPVWYPLAVNSLSSAPTIPLPGFNDETSRSIAAFLIYPHVFVQKPLDWSQEVFTSSNQFGPSVSLDTKPLSASNLALFFELYRASPEALHVGGKSIPLLPLFSNPSEPVAASHPDDCDSYPDCLADVTLDTVDPELQVHQLHSIWAKHRLRQYTDAGSHQHSDGGENSSNPLHGPLFLMDLCRLHIRRLIVNRLSELSKSEGTAVNGLNYPKFVSRLGLPARLQSFLAFRDLWPAYKRHRIPRSQRLPLRHHEVLVPDPWFPIPYDF